jgi:hypothetical protein
MRLTPVPAPPPLDGAEAENLYKHLEDSVEDRKQLGERLEIVEGRLDRVVDGLDTVAKKQDQILIALAEHKAKTADQITQLVLRVGAGFGGGAVAGGGAVFAAWPLLSALARELWRAAFGH